eukprot:1528643-Rhodomonas_salina.2
MSGLKARREFRASSHALQLLCACPHFSHSQTKRDRTHSHCTLSQNIQDADAQKPCLPSSLASLPP